MIDQAPWVRGCGGLNNQKVGFKTMKMLHGLFYDQHGKHRPGARTQMEVTCRRYGISGRRLRYWAVRYRKWLIEQEQLKSTALDPDQLFKGES